MTAESLMSRTVAEWTAATTSRRAARPMLADERGQPGEDVRVGAGEHTVPEVEDVARASTGAAEDVSGRPLDALPRAEQHRRVEVALDAPVSDLRPTGVERHAPVEPDHVAAGCGHLPEERGGAGA